MRVGQNLGQENLGVLIDDIKEYCIFTEHRLKVEGINPLWSLGAIVCCAGWHGAEMLGVAPRSTESHHH